MGNSFDELRAWAVTSRRARNGVVAAGPSVIAELRELLSYGVRAWALEDGVVPSAEQVSAGVEYIMDKYFSALSPGLVAHGNHDQSTHGNWSHPGEGVYGDEEAEVEETKKGLGRLWGKAKAKAASAAESVAEAKDALASEVSEKAEAIGEKLDKVGDAVSETASKVAAAPGNAVESVAEGVESAVEGTKKVAGTAADLAVSGVKLYVGYKVVQAGVRAAVPGGKNAFGNPEHGGKRKSNVSRLTGMHKKVQGSKIGTTNRAGKWYNPRTNRYE